MKTSSLPERADGGPNDCAADWPEIGRIAGPCIRPGGRVLTERALEVCTLPPGSLVADIGCGAGGTLEHLERTGIYRTVGLDFSQTLLAEALPRLVTRRLVRGRAETLPFKDGFFDALFCECVLSILGERTAALDECTRVLKDGGFLIISDVFNRVACEQGCPEGGPQGTRAVGPFTRRELLGLLKTLGFSLLLWEDHERFLKEFAARMILAGVRLPDPWGCGKGDVRGKVDRAGIGYFLLVARKGGGPFPATHGSDPAMEGNG